MTGDLRTIHNVSTIECSQSVPDTQTLEFKMILDYRVKDHTTHIAADYEQLNVEMVELRWLVMEMR